METNWSRNHKFMLSANPSEHLRDQKGYANIMATRDTVMVTAATLGAMETAQLIMDAKILQQTV
jgi:hypothetical protein